MTDDFISDFRAQQDFDDDDFDDDLPEWLDDIADEEIESFAEEVPAEEEEEDDFDQLRRKSARTSATYEEMELDDESESGLSIRQLSPVQRLLLAILLLLNVVVIAVIALLLLNVI